MGFISYFSSKDVKLLAVDLVGEIVRDIPPKILSVNAKVLSANRISHVLESVYEKAYMYKQSNGMGLLRRAVFANTFRWGLAEAGYSEDFVRVATEGVVLYLSRGK